MLVGSHGSIGRQGAILFLSTAVRTAVSVGKVLFFFLVLLCACWFALQYRPCEHRRAFVRAIARYREHKVARWAHKCCYDGCYIIIVIIITILRVSYVLAY